MNSISDHFERLGLKYDAVYTFFVSERQMNIVLDFINKISTEKTLIFVDPVWETTELSVLDSLLVRR